MVYERARHHHNGKEGWSAEERSRERSRGDEREEREVILYIHQHIEGGQMRMARGGGETVGGGAAIVAQFASWPWTFLLVA